jgi:hypothetical protein
MNQFYKMRIKNIFLILFEYNRMIAKFALHF